VYQARDTHLNRMVAIKVDRSSRFGPGAGGEFPVSLI
jgi:hypothetical protein